MAQLLLSGAGGPGKRLGAAGAEGRSGPEAPGMGGGGRGMGEGGERRAEGCVWWLGQFCWVEEGALPFLTVRFDCYKAL